MSDTKKRQMGPKGCAKRIRETAEKFNELVVQAKELGLNIEIDYRDEAIFVGPISYNQDL